MKTTVLIFVLSFISFSSLKAQTQFYVDASAMGVNNGSSWSNAFNELSDAMDLAGANDTVRIAAGTYRPAGFPAGCSNCSSPRDRAFKLVSGVVVMGGYPPGGGGDASRDWMANQVILDGDIGVADDSTDNCFHVLVSQGQNNLTELFGLYIQNGNADSTGSVIVNSDIISRNNAGAVFLNKGDLTISECIIRNNHAEENGGAIYASNNGNLTIDSVLISNCDANNDGGGIWTTADTFFMTRSTVQFCQASFDGGGIYSQSVNRLSSSDFNGNHSDFDGGALFLDALQNHFSSLCFDNNTSEEGGAIKSANNTIRIDSCTFKNNKATFKGGVISSIQDTITVINSSFVNNQCNSLGGVFYFISPYISVERCLFNNNMAQNGGCFYPTAGNVNNIFSIKHSIFVDNRTLNNGSITLIPAGCEAVLKFVNNTITQHSNQSFSAAVHATNESPIITNCNFWKNEGDIFTSGAATTDEVTYCNIDLGSGTGNINTDPLFLDTANLDFRLRLNSPLIDAGTNTPIGVGDSLDYDGEHRIVRDTVDIGAHEFFYELPCGAYESLTLDETPVYTGNYRANGSITSSGTVNADSEGPVFFFSESGIELQANFEVFVGFVFEAKVEDPCQ